jgi:hypothetical protein
MQMAAILMTFSGHATKQTEQRGQESEGGWFESYDTDSPHTGILILKGLMVHIFELKGAALGYLSNKYHGHGFWDTDNLNCFMRLDFCLHHTEDDGPVVSYK